MAETIKDVKNKIKKNTEAIDTILSGGFDSEIVRKNNELLNKIRLAISNQGVFSKEQTGLSLLTLLNNGLIEKRQVKEGDKVETKKLINLDSLLNNSENSTALNAILANESSRIELYKDYERIYDLIPQMAIAVDRYVDNIISPDDLTKVGLTMVYDKPRVNKREQEEVDQDYKVLNQKYELDKKAPKIIKDALIKGDCFYAVISVRDRVNTVLSESGEDKIVEVTEPTKILLEDNYFVQEIEDFVVERFNRIEDKLKLLGESSEEYKEKHKALLESKARSMKIYSDYSHIVQKMVNENVIIADSSVIINESSEIVRDYQNTENPTLGSQKTPSVHTATSKYTYTPVNNREKIEQFRIFSEPRDKNDKMTDGDLKIKGSIVKKLEPERVVKLERDGMEFGYLYFENFEDSYFLNNISYESDVKVFDKIFGKINSREDLDKKQLIYNMFIRGISQRINKSTLEKFPEFTTEICKLLDLDNIVQKQIRITYFRPEEVIHFGNDDKDDVYYDSLFRRILFTSKMYLSMLTTALLYKLVRAPSKRIFYIEVGLDNDDGEAVSSFVRDLKTKELRFNDIAGSSINNVLSLVSCFNDIYVPVVDNQKPIEVESAQEDSPNMDADLADKFMKDMTSGVGIPHAYIADSENVQFAKSLSMENLAFMRKVVVLQIIFGAQFSKFLQTLYKNEFPEKLAENIKKVKKEDNKEDMEYDQTIVDLEFVKVAFPCPTTLNMTVANEQSGTVQTIAEFVIKALLGDPPSNAGPNDSYERDKNALFTLVVKKYLPNINWADFEDLLKAAKVKSAGDKVEYDADNAQELDADESYGDDESEY